jgi:hypothetical protein
MSFGYGSIREDREGITVAKQIRLLCPHCNSTVFVEWGYPFSAETRQTRIKEAIEEHRVLCSGAPPEAGRVYRIDYPRA